FAVARNDGKKIPSFEGTIFCKRESLDWFYIRIGRLQFSLDLD
ncbi:MAG: hypothetical protein JWP88_491, partial [Flaviaesturariibacter sp.]|nr:hypothetical protein [Flaviaesturariibacter sp.]